LNTTGKQTVAVIGAGPMGLGAAYQLALDGHTPVVFEADDRIGGMAAAFDFGDLRIERYYHFHCTSDHDLFALLHELGLEDRLQWVATKMGYYFDGRIQAWGNPHALLAFRGLNLIDKARYGLHAFLATKRDNWRPLDRLEATRWIRRWVGEHAYDVLWRSLFELKFYEFSHDLSAAWIWSRIRRIGRSRYSIFKEKLGFIEGGSEAVLNAMSAEIVRRRGQIRLSCPVQRVRLDGGAVSGIETREGFFPCGRIISTVPMPYVARIMPDLPVELLNVYRAIKSIAVVCVIAKLARSVSENFWLNINDPDMDIPGLVEYSNLRPLDRHIVYVPFYMPGENPKFGETDASFAEKVKRYLRRINPALREEDILDIHVSRYRFAQPVCTPGFGDRLPPPKLPIRGLFVADTCFYYPEDRGISESIGLARRIARMAIE
jgi:protoporphyrinogen oxidase